MKKGNLKRNIVLSILFFLPVAFLLMLYPAKHNYTPLDIVKSEVMDLNGFNFENNETIQLKDHITVLAFFGKNPLENALMASNLKELIYDKFKGFKKFQIVALVENGTENEIQDLKREVNSYEDLRFWHYAYGSSEALKTIFGKLRSQINLNTNLATDHVFIIDKDLNQRGRLDDRDKNEIEVNKPMTPLVSYDCIEVAVIKNKMSEDLRILFTEYRQKRKDNFDSTIRRAEDLKQNDN